MEQRVVLLETQRNILFRDGEGCEVVCSAGVISTTSTQEICANEKATVAVVGEDIPTGGGFAFRFVPGTDGTGGNGGLFFAAVDSNSYTFNNDLNGLLSDDALPPLAGTWNVSAVSYTDSDNIALSICDLTADSAVVVFKDSSECDFSTCVAGSLLNTSSESICPSETFGLATNGDEIVPDGGIFAWLLVPGFDGTGGLNDTFIVTGFSTEEDFNNDLNGLLSGNSQDPLEGTWSFYSQVFSDSIDLETVCDVSSDFKTITFLTETDSDCETDTTCVLYASGAGPYTAFIEPTLW